jgi:hypothetical protein
VNRLAALVRPDGPVAVILIRLAIGAVFVSEGIQDALLGRRLTVPGQRWTAR